MEEKINETTQSPSVRRKKILFVITQSELGGAQQFLAQLTKGLPAEHFDCTVAVGADGGGQIRRHIPDMIPYVVLQHLRRAANLPEDIRSLFELRRLYKALKPDVIFLNSSKAGFNGSLAAKGLIGPTVIYRIGGWSFNDPQSNWKRRISILLERLSDSWKDYIIVNNQKDLLDAHKLRIKPRKELLLIHNGIDPYPTLMEQHEARIKLFERIFHHQISQDQGGQARLFHAKYLVGTIANFYPTKGLDVLLSAAAQSQADAVYIIIGEGALRLELQEQIRAMHLEKKVYLAGRIPDAGDLMQAFDLFVLPSRKEGFPWAVLEAMSAKVPIVATSVGALPEIIEQGKNGLLVPPNNPNALADAITTMLIDENLRLQCGIEGHQTVIHRFSLQKMLGEYEGLLSRV